MKGMQMENEEVKLSLFANGIILYILLTREGRLSLVQIDMKRLAEEKLVTCINKKQPRANPKEPGEISGQADLKSTPDLAFNQWPPSCAGRT